MPRATINRNETFRFELSTCPDGYVVLRKLSYHEMMQRIDMMGRIVYETPGGNRAQRRRNREQKDTQQAVRSMLESANVVVMEFEFKNSILDHNLEDETGALLDFSNPHTLRNLDPKIGAEIGRYIDDLNQVDDDDFLPSANAPTSSLEDGPTLQSESTDQAPSIPHIAGSGTEG